MHLLELSKPNAINLSEVLVSFMLKAMLSLIVVVWVMQSKKCVI